MSVVTVPFFISHQGCPHTCVFCDQAAISGSNGSLPDSREIAARIGSWRRTSGGRTLEVAFFGGSFTSLPRRTQAGLLLAVQPFLASGEVAAIRISTRPDALDDATVEWLAGQGVATIEIGVQSVDDAVLTAAGRGHGAETCLAALRCVKSRGLVTGAQLMPGLPGDSPSLALRSLERVIDAGADFVRLYPTVVLRGTELAARYLAGTYQPLTLQGGVALCKDLLRTALRRNTPVIRIGLQAGEGLRQDAILAGCWHPALGELVYGELFYDLLLQLLDTERGSHRSLVVGCHPSRISSVIGHKRCNLERLARERRVTVERVVPDGGLSPLACRISWPGGMIEGALVGEDDTSLGLH